MTEPPPFELNERLAADCHILGRFHLCHVLLHRNAIVTWFILVPETHVTDLFDLSTEEQQQAGTEVGWIADFLKTECGATKLNYGSIGNLVSQLHLHVISRSESDPCWPAPVWGNLNDTREYDPARIKEIQQSLQEHYRLTVA